jgi:hypothetical protein
LYYFVVSATNAAAAVESANSAAAAVRPLAANPPTLSAALGSGQLQLNWPQDHTGWMLQVQTNLLYASQGSNWITVPNSTNASQLSLPVAVTNASVFFRLAYP